MQNQLGPVKRSAVKPKGDDEINVPMTRAEARYILEKLAGASNHALKMSGKYEAQGLTKACEAFEDESIKLIEHANIFTEPLGLERLP